jgi:hypothetical protein
MTAQFTATQLADWLEAGANDPLWDSHTEMPKYILASASAKLKQLYQQNQELLSALKATLPYVVTQSVGCHGYKCRENWCWSCNDEEEAEKAAQAGLYSYVKGHAVVAKVEGEP